MDASQYTSLRFELESVIDKDKDSLRFYKIGNNYRNKVEHVGIKPSIDIEGTLII